MAPWLSVITCTARAEPRFALMADSLAAAPSGVLEWIVVNALLWYDAGARADALEAAVRGRFDVQHRPPKPTPWQGPTRAPEHPADLPHLNNARNTGIIAAHGEYLLFLDDCSVLAGPWPWCAKAAAQRGAAMQVSYHDLWRESDDPLEGFGPSNEILDVNGLAFCGSGSGCPLEAALAVNGFDEDFAGLAGDNDVEFFVRVERTRIPMLRFPGAVVAELAAGHGDAHVPRHRDRRRTRLRRLLKDGGRKLPYAQQIDLAAARRENSR